MLHHHFLIMIICVSVLIMSNYQGGTASLEEYQFSIVQCSKCEDLNQNKSIRNSFFYYVILILISQTLSPFIYSWSSQNLLCTIIIELEHIRYLTDSSAKGRCSRKSRFSNANLQSREISDNESYEDPEIDLTDFIHKITQTLNTQKNV